MSPPSRHLFLLPLLLAFTAGAETNSVFHCRAKVVDANGQPVPGAIVERYCTPVPVLWRYNLQLVGRLAADQDGAATFTATNEAWSMFVASKPGFSMGWASTTPFAGVDEDIETITLSAPHCVWGQVQDADGRPVPDATVWVSFAIQTMEGTAAWQAPLTSRLGGQVLLRAHRP